MKTKNTGSTIVRKFLCVSLLVLGAGATALGQAGRGGISGLISDPSGAIVPGAKVTAQNNATGVKISTVSTAAGLYSFISLSPGIYEVTTSEKGFETAVRTNVVVTVDQGSIVNITLQIGNVTEVVSVNESSSLVDTSNSTVGQLISAETIDRVPLLTRNVYDLVQLSAGVTPANGSPNSSSSRPSSISRRAGRESMFRLTPSTAPSSGRSITCSTAARWESPKTMQPRSFRPWRFPKTASTSTAWKPRTLRPPIRAAEQASSAWSANPAANKFHGDAFGVFRPDVLAANDYFNKQSQLLNGLPNSHPRFIATRKAARSAGRSCTRSCSSLATTRRHSSKVFDGSNTFTVPTTAERTGDFSNMGFTIYDPTLPDNADGTRQPVAGNKIANPNPIALKFLSEFPKCNFPSASTCDAATTDVVPNLYVPGLDPTTAAKIRRSHRLLQEREAAHLRPLLLRQALHLGRQRLQQSVGL